MNGWNLLALKEGEPAYWGVGSHLLDTQKVSHLPLSRVTVAPHLSMSFVHLCRLNDKRESRFSFRESREQAATVRVKRGNQITCTAFQPETEERKPVELGTGAVDLAETSVR